MTTSQLQLAAQARIWRTGFDFSIRYTTKGDRYAVNLTKNGVRVATDLAGRSGHFNIGQAEQRAREGVWPTSSGVYKALERLAIVAETLVCESAVYLAKAREVAEREVADRIAELGPDVSASDINALNEADLAARVAERVAAAEVAAKRL